VCVDRVFAGSADARGTAEGLCCLRGKLGHTAVEVKTGSFQMNDLKGPLELVRRHPGLRPLVICDDSRLATAEHRGVQAIFWKEFLLNGSPRAR
jgi:hypothetical protein